MSKIIQLSPHIANLIAAGEVVERPASVVKELVENAIDAGACAVTVEIRNGGMTFLRVTDNGCGMELEDAKTAFLRHATSKLRTAEDLAAITTMGFRGEALAAIASVSRIDLLTKTPGSICGTSLSLEAGQVSEEGEAGCPDGTTIIVRDLFFNTPARMKFMKSDVAEGSKIADVIQQQALAHPNVAFRFLRDGKEVLSTPGTGKLPDVLYSIYGKQAAAMAKVDSAWEGYTLHGFVSLPTQARPSRSMQTFLVNGRPVRSRIMIAALEEAYRNKLMNGRFPACVLHLTLPPASVDVNVHPAKTEVKFLNEKAVFDCIHYGVLGALNQTFDRPDMHFKPQPKQEAPVSKPQSNPGFFRTMNAQEYKAFSQAVADAPRPEPKAAAAVAEKITQMPPILREPVVQPQVTSTPLPLAVSLKKEQEPVVIQSFMAPDEPQQQAIPMPREEPWRLVGELYRSYILVEQGEEAFLIDKHAAHERILFDKLKENQEAISSQALLTPLPCRFAPNICGVLLSEKELLQELGFEVDAFGENALLLRQVPMDLSPEDGADALEEIAAGLLSGRRETGKTVRDDILHTVACKAAIKAGWHTDEKELLALCRTVMEREDLKYCPHGRPICVSLSKKQLEKQFKRT